MIPREWLRKIRRIEIRTNRLIDDLLSGQYQSIFKGRGMDFEEVREYQAGDDVRSIDWNVTGRTGIPHIKKFREERELTVMLLVDASASGIIGSGQQTKRELAAELASLFAFSAIRNNDKVGLLLFTDQVEKFINPRKGRSHVLRVIREILFFEPKHQGTRITAALHYLNHVVTRRAVVFVISDFLDEGFEKALKITNQRHDVVAIPILDPRERELPNVGSIALEDSETGEVFTIDTSSAKIREAFTQNSLQLAQKIETSFRSAGVDSIPVETDQSYLKAISRFFERRSRRIRL
jgi:uncharacterized protein (DUF58 family)